MFDRVVMSPSLPLGLILACCVLFGSCTDSMHADSGCANSSCQSCAVPSNCRNPLLYPTGFSPLETPYYEHVKILDSSNRQTDSVCITFFKIVELVFLAFRSIVTTNGTVYIEKYILGYVPDSPGVNTVQGARTYGIDNNGCYSCVLNNYAVQEACPSTYVLYRCTYAGDCHANDNNEEVRVGISTYRDLSECCKDRIIALANEQSDVFYKSRNFIKLPGLLKRKCVKFFNGASCIGSEKIRPGDAISLPQHDSCAQGSRSDL